MKHAVKDHVKPGKSYEDAEAAALEELVDAFAEQMKQKLFLAMKKGRYGWDDEGWDRREIYTSLIQHTEGITAEGKVPDFDPVDVANFAAFYWNRIT